MNKNEIVIATMIMNINCNNKFPVCYAHISSNILLVLL